MKRFILPTVFFYLCTFAAPAPVRAGVPLALIGAAAIGATMLSSSIGTYYAQNGTMPEYVTATANAAASASDYLFQPAHLAVGPLSLVTAASFPNAMTCYLAKEASLGAKIGDIVDFVKDSAAGLYSNFKNLINESTPVTMPVIASSVDFAPGTVFATLEGNKKVSQASFYYLGVYLPSQIVQYTESPSVPIGDNGTFKFYYLSGYVYRTLYVDAWDIQLWRVPVVSTTDSPTFEPINDSTVDWDAFKNKLTSPLPATVLQEISNILKDMPASQVEAKSEATIEDSAPPALTQAEINNLLKANTAEVAQKAAEAAAQTAAANPLDAAAQIAAQQAALEAAKAAQEAAYQEEAKEETYNPIAESGFAEPYNPGEYDISERFSSFLNTIKFSGLFSFSSSFFNSLPGGGSPVYEIEAGQYGHHTIDLSQTLSIGLAVLKTVLLACFGFLSIRAVIMKR